MERAKNDFVEILKQMREGPKPVICAVNGHAFGGGIGLVAAADIAIAVRGAKFAFSEVRIGVIPAIISVVVLPKLGEHHAMRLFVTGERFSAAEALGYGLVHRVVEDCDLESAVQAEIDAIAKGAPNAVAAAKRLVREIPARSPMTPTRLRRRGLQSSSLRPRPPRGWRRLRRSGRRVGSKRTTTRPERLAPSRPSARVGGYQSV